MNEQLKKKIEFLSAGVTKEYLVDFLEYVKGEVADIRNLDLDLPTRKGVIEAIDHLIINKLRQNDSCGTQDTYN